MAAAPFSSIIIPVYKDARSLRALLTELSNQTVPRTEYEIIVANDGADPAVEAVSAAFGAVHVALQPQQGTGAARDAAYRIARGELFGFTDADVNVPPDWIERGRALLAEHDYVGGAIHVIEPDPPTLWSRYCALFEFRNDLCMARHGFSMTANLWVRREALRAVGGFDRAQTCGDDLVLGQKTLVHGGFNRRYVDELAVGHGMRTVRQHLLKHVRVALNRRNRARLLPGLEQKVRRILGSDLDNCYVARLGLVIRCVRTEASGALLLALHLSVASAGRLLVLWYRLQRHPGGVSVWGFARRTPVPQPDVPAAGHAPGSGMDRVQVPGGAPAPAP